MEKEYQSYIVAKDNIKEARIDIMFCRMIRLEKGKKRIVNLKGEVVNVSIK